MYGTPRNVLAWIKWVEHILPMMQAINYPLDALFHNWRIVNGIEPQ